MAQHFKPERILLPTDFSEGAARSMNVARQIAKRFGATIYLVHVDEERAMGMHSSADLIHFMNDVDSRRKEWMERMADELVDDGFAVELERLEGVASEEILTFSERAAVDLIVMGTLGHTTLEHMLLGSTIRAVIRHASSPVLTVNTRFGDDKPWNVNNVLFPTDFSDVSIAGLTMAAEAARALDAGVNILHVLKAPTYIPTIPGEPPLFLPRQAFDTALNRTATELTELAERPELAGLISDTGVILSGDTADGIVSYGTENDCQLTVIPRHGRSGIRSMLFGRAIEHVVKLSPNPVLSFTPKI